MGDVKIKFVYQKTEDGNYVAFCPKLKGCMSQGVTLEEVKENIREAAKGWLEAKTFLMLHTLIEKNHNAKISENGKRTGNITITPKLTLAGV